MHGSYNTVSNFFLAFLYLMSTETLLAQKETEKLNKKFTIGVKYSKLIARARISNQETCFCPNKAKQAGGSALETVVRRSS